MIREAIISLLLTLTTTICSAQGFNLIVVGDPQPQTEAQMRSLEEEVAPLIGDIVAEYKATNLPTAILLTGDVVWDTMEFLPRVKSLFESFGVPVYAVIGNHDHDRKIDGNEPLAESHYEACFGERYYTFTMGDTKFFALDNIDYNNYYDYSLGISREQLRWLRREMRKTSDNQRVAILMHAPASNFRKGEPIPYAKRLIRLTKGHELHFVTGHGHRHFTADISDNVIEHSVAQVNGNLWFAPMCADGTPRGVFCIEERNGNWQWHHRVLGKSADEALIVWKMDDKENSDNAIIIKAIGWDDRWQVEWFENGESKGALESIEMCDPGYIYYVEHKAQYEDVIMERLRRSALPSRGYFRCLPTKKNSEITIIATDRFGRKYIWNNATN
jgi:hypothetical protein